MTTMSIEFHTGFRRSSYCHNGSCVEVEPRHGEVAVRDTKNTRQAELRYTTAEWVAFIRGVKAGEFDFGLLSVQDPPAGT
jgi:hypothetical protein